MDSSINDAEDTAFEISDDDSIVSLVKDPAEQLMLLAKSTTARSLGGGNVDLSSSSSSSSASPASLATAFVNSLQMFFSGSGAIGEGGYNNNAAGALVDIDNISGVITSVNNNTSSSAAIAITASSSSSSSSPSHLYTSTTTTTTNSATIIETLLSKNKASDNTYATAAAGLASSASRLFSTPSTATSTTSTTTSTAVTRFLSTNQEIAANTTTSTSTFQSTTTPSFIESLLQLRESNENNIGDGNVTTIAHTTQSSPLSSSSSIATTIVDFVSEVAASLGIDSPHRPGSITTANVNTTTAAAATTTTVSATTSITAPPLPTRRLLTIGVRAGGGYNWTVAQPAFVSTTDMSQVPGSSSSIITYQGSGTSSTVDITGGEDFFVKYNPFNWQDQQFENFSLIAIIALMLIFGMICSLIGFCCGCWSERRRRKQEQSTLMFDSGSGRHQIVNFGSECRSPYFHEHHHGQPCSASKGQMPSAGGSHSVGLRSDSALLGHGSNLSSINNPRA